ncbi:MAG TPA: MauE/DoxX family redox-associated membrane protein [Candidatus Eisenbacteria bacterium]|nr:MauE/DoxX family redox-associated membrane protein [Candidatus Eisenbacteria bacterium]
MMTPIVMLVLMTAPYLVVRVISRATHGYYDTRGAAAIGLAALFGFTGIGHFVETEAMAQMLPPWLPARIFLVYLTGILEFAIAAGFLIRKFRRATGWVAAALLVLFFPVNIYAAVNHVPMGGHAWGPVYLLIRAPLQITILLWTYRFTIRRAESVL